MKRFLKVVLAVLLADALAVLIYTAAVMLELSIGPLWLFIPLFILLSPAIVLKFVLQGRVADEWAEFAGKHGFRKRRWTLTRQSETTYFKVTRRVRYHGTRGYAYTTFSAQFDPQAMPDVFLNTVTIGQYALRTVGKQDLEVGLPAVDSSFLISGSHPEGIRAWAQQPEVAGTLQMLAEAGGVVELGPGFVQITRRGVNGIETLDWTLQVIEAAIAALSRRD